MTISWAGVSIYNKLCFHCLYYNSFQAHIFHSLLTSFDQQFIRGINSTFGAIKMVSRIIFFLKHFDDKMWSINPQYNKMIYFLMYQNKQSYYNYKFNNFELTSQNNNIEKKTNIDTDENSKMNEILLEMNEMRQLELKYGKNLFGKQYWKPFDKIKFVKCIKNIQIEINVKFYSRLVTLFTIISLIGYILRWIAIYNGYGGISNVDVNYYFFGLKTSSFSDIILIYFDHFPRLMTCIVFYLTFLHCKYKLRYFVLKNLSIILGKKNGKEKRKRQRKRKHDFLSQYKELRCKMKYHLFWIKIYMFCDLIQVSIQMWFWIYVLFDDSNNFESLFLEGFGFLLFYASGVFITWFSAAMLSHEVEILTKSIFKNYKSYVMNQSRNTNNSNNDSNSDDTINDKQQYQLRLNRIEKLQDIQSLLLYMNEKSCDFKVLGIKITYQTLVTTIVFFAVGKMADLLTNIAWA